MAEVASPPQPQPISTSGLTISPPRNIPVPSPAKAFRGGHLSLDTFSPVTQNGSYEFDRIVKSGDILKRTRKTKVGTQTYVQVEQVTETAVVMEANLHSPSAEHPLYLPRQERNEASTSNQSLRTHSSRAAEGPEAEREARVRTLLAVA